jgi:hypothetical protein
MLALGLEVARGVFGVDFGGVAVVVRCRNIQNGLWKRLRKAVVMGEVRREGPFYTTAVSPVADTAIGEE